MDKLMIAIRLGDAQKLEDIMAADIRFYADGGGKVPLVTDFAMGAAHVAGLQILIYDRYLRQAKIVSMAINHQSAYSPM